MIIRLFLKTLSEAKGLSMNDNKKVRNHKRKCSSSSLFTVLMFETVVMSPELVNTELLPLGEVQD